MTRTLAIIFTRCAFMDIYYTGHWNVSVFSWISDYKCFSTEQRKSGNIESMQIKQKYVIQIRLRSEIENSKSGTQYKLKIVQLYMPKYLDDRTYHHMISNYQTLIGGEHRSKHTFIQIRHPKREHTHLCKYLLQIILRGIEYSTSIYP